MAGLAVARSLVDRGVRDFTVFDGKPAFTNDRTWCWWDADPTIRARTLASFRWPAWRIADDRREVRRAGGAPYLHLRAADYYADAATVLRAAGVRIRLDAPVRTIEPKADGAAVRLADETIDCDVAIDARGAMPFASHVVQRFVGFRVRTPRPAFDPACVTLMDFRVPQPGRIRFMYVLPFDAQEALVEETTIGSREPAEPRTAVGERVAAYLRDRLGCDGEAVEAERGEIPMDARRVAPTDGPYVWRVGTAGGAVRASSGYAFVRAQRHADAVAEAFVRGAAAPTAPFGAGYRALDALLLGLFARRPAHVERFFGAFAARLPAAAFARFMCDASAPGDAARIAVASAGAACEMALDG